jgi:uncharacterized OB-fold protein
MDKHQAMPPLARTPLWRSISEAAEVGEFVLQVCKNCATIQYPPRELCRDCLHDELEWQDVASSGELVSHTFLHASTSAFFREHSPRQVALVKLDCGPVVFAHMAYAEARTGDRLAVLNKRDLSGEGVFIAIVETGDEQAQLAELNTLLLPKNKSE